MNKLSVLKILDYNDFPLVFIAKDIVGTKYLCFFATTLNDIFIYYATKVSDKRLNEFETGKIDLRTIYIEPEIAEYYKIVLKEDTDITFEYEIIEDIYEWLPLEGYYNVPTVIDNSLKNMAITLNKNIYQMHIAEEGKIDAVSIILLYEYLKLASGLVKNSLIKAQNKMSNKIKKRTEIIKSNSLDVFAFSPGSLNVYFRTPLFVDMFGNSDDEIFLNKMKELINIDINDEVSIKEVFKKNRGHVINTIYILCNRIISQNIPFELFYATPDSKESGSLLINTERAKKYKTIIEQKNELKNEVVIFKCYFVEADSEKGNWRVRLIDEDAVVNGKSEPSKLIGITIEDKKYKIICTETIEEDEITGNEKSKYIIEKIELITNASI